MHFQSDLPDINVQLDDKTCHVPCTLNIRRQWGTFNLQATQGDRIVAEGPIYRREEYEGDKCKDELSGLTVAAFIDGLLIVPGIIDVSTGIIVWHPETVVIQQGSYLLEDQCFEKPVVGSPH